MDRKDPEKGSRNECENKIKCSAQDAPHRCCRFSTYLTPSTTRPCACFASNAERSFGPTRGRTASASASRSGPVHWCNQERRWQQRRFSFPPPSPRCIEEKAAKGIGIEQRGSQALPTLALGIKPHRYVVGVDGHILSTFELVDHGLPKVDEGMRPILEKEREERAFFLMRLADERIAPLNFFAEEP